MQDPKGINNAAHSSFNAAFLTPSAALQHAKDQLDDFIGALPGQPGQCAIDLSSMVILENGLARPGSTHVFQVLIIARIQEEEGKP
jgi:hypothetical protein